MVLRSITLPIAVVFSLCGVSDAQPPTPIPTPLPVVAPLLPTRTVIAPGVTLIQEVIPEQSPDGPLTITIFEVDLKKRGVTVRAALGQDRVWGTDATLGREVVSSMAARRHAVAAINAGFFPFAGNPLGLHIQDGEMVTEPMLNRSCLLIDREGGVQVDAFTYSGQVMAHGRDKETSLPLAGVNRRPSKTDDLLLYTPIFFARTLKQSGRFEVVLSDIKGALRPNHTFSGKVSAINEGGLTPLSPETVVLSGNGAGADFLRQNASIGKKLSFRLDVGAVSGAKVDFSQIKEALAGGPRLITEGKVTVTTKEEGFAANFAAARHPRTAVGVTRDGKLLLVVVDGRQKGVSRGMSLQELAYLFLKYDTQNAVNLDGGGSSVAIARDLILNSPSDGPERPVANALLVFARLPDKESSNKEQDENSLLSGPPAPLLPGDRFFFSLPSGVKGIWGVTGGIGFVSQTGVFTAVRVGSGTVQFLREKSATPIRISVTVAPAPRPTPTPKPEPGEPET